MKRFLAIIVLLVATPVSAGLEFSGGSGSSSMVPGAGSTVTQSQTQSMGDLAPIPYFQGYGTTNTHARSQSAEIIHITTLADNCTSDDSEITFREATTACGDVSQGNRFIVSDVSGSVELSSSLGDLVIASGDGDFFFAGQSAPAPGLQIIGGEEIEISGDNIVFQHLAIRPGGTDVTRDTVQILSSASNVIFDHCSLYWGMDETLSIYGDNVTIQNCIIAEGLDYNSHSCGNLIMYGADNIALLRNLYARHNSRGPWVRESTTVYHANNVSYNMAGTFFNFTCDAGTCNGELISEGNVYKKGPLSSGTKGLSESSNFTDLGDADVYEDDSLDATDTGKFTAIANLVNLETGHRVETYPFTAPSYTPMDSSLVEAWVSDNAGSRPGSRDTADSRVISDLENSTGTGLVNTPAAVGVPTYAENESAYVEPSNPLGVRADGFYNIEYDLYVKALALE